MPVMRMPTLATLIRILKWPVDKWRIVAAAFCCIGILHITTTLAVPYMLPSPVFDHLKPKFPANQMHYLPPVTPATQLLPFMGPDTMYAICRFDSRQSPVMISAYLPGSGWSLSIYAQNGVARYSAAGQEDRPISIDLTLIPSTVRFQGLTPEALGIASRKGPQQRVQVAQGLAVIRAPDRGLAHRRQLELDIEKSTCYGTDP